MKLDLARRLIKPELNVDENDFDVTTTPYSGKSKAKEPTASESKSTEKTTRATKVNGSRLIPHGSEAISENARREKPSVKSRWKLVGIPRKFPKNPNLDDSSGSPATKKARVIPKSTVAPFPVERSSAKSFVELNAIPRKITVSHRGTTSAEETAATTIDTNKIRSPMSQSTTAVSREETSTLVIDLVNAIDENIILTTEPVEPMKLGKTLVETTTKFDQARDVYDIQRETTTVASSVTSTTDASTVSTGYLTTEFAQEITLSPTVTTPRNSHLSSAITTTTMSPNTLYPVYIPGTESDDSQDTTKNSFRPRYTKQQTDKVSVSMVTSRTVGPTSRYIRKKSGVFTQFDAVPKVISTESPVTQTKRREFRPRTATYRRHSEMPTNSLVPTAAKQETTVDVTPKPTKFHSSVKSSTTNTRSVPTEPFVNVRVDAPSAPNLVGITDSSNGLSGSNIFNPTRSAFLAVSNTTTLLEQLRSTVAPLLNNLGNKTPVFSGAYSNVENNGVSAAESGGFRSAHPLHARLRLKDSTETRLTGFNAHSFPANIMMY